MIDRNQNKEVKLFFSYSNSKVGFVLQDFGLLSRETVIENVCVPLLFSDCPFTKMKRKALDELKLVGIDDFISLLEELNKQGKTVVIVTYDLSIAKRCGRVIEIVDGKI